MMGNGNGNGTALATRNGQNSTALDRFGSDEEMRLLMVRSAAIFGIPAEEVERPDVQASLKKATQYCVMYGWMPGIHIHMTPYKKKVKVGNRDEWITTYVPVDGEKAWKESADRQSQMGKFAYVVETEELSAVEVEELTAATPGQEYDPDDKGFRARALRSDHAELYRSMGRPYEPSWSYGFWRKKARQKDEWVNERKTGKTTWESDTLPNGRMPRDVAERRATKAALMKVFSLVPLNDYEESQRLAKLSSYVAQETEIVRDLPQIRALPAETVIGRDTDDILYWGEEPAGNEGHYRHVDQDTGEITEEPPADIDFGMGPPPPATDDDPDADWNEIPGAGPGGYRHLIERLTDQPLQFAEWARAKHIKSAGPATGPQYRYLVATINGITGQDSSHYAILEILTARPTNSDSPPGYDLTKCLLDWLVEEKSEKDEATGKKTKTKNPQYRADYVNCIRVIWRTVQEAQGQQTLLEPA